MDCERASRVSDVRIDGKENIRHVTIRQIKGAKQMHETAPWTIDETEVSSLMVVANIFRCEAEMHELWFELDDGTGRIRCLMRECKFNPTFDDFAYVRAILRHRKSKKYLEAMHLNIVTDPHEIFYHSLKVIEESLQHRKDPSMDPSHSDHAENMAQGQDKPEISPSPAKHSQMNTVFHDASDPLFHCRISLEEPSSNLDGGHIEQDDWLLTRGLSRTFSSATVASYHTAVSGRDPSPDPPSIHSQELDRRPPPSKEIPALTHMDHSLRTPNSRMNDPYGHLSNLQRDILLCINHALEHMKLYGQPRELGVHVREILQRLAAKHGVNLTEPEFAEDIEFLLEEGYIFTTIDDVHYNLVQSV